MTLQELKDKVKERADFSAVVGRHTKLVRTARGFKACCPLPGHKEKTPSFHLDTDKSYFFCYGCNRGGDIFTFLQMVEGLPFMDALKELANQQGLELPKASGNFTRDQEASDQAKSERDAGLELLERAARFYSRILLDGATAGASQAAAYLSKRGISEHEVAELRLGWSPESGDVLSRKLALQEKSVAVAASLARDYDGRIYDFFKKRLMIPINDPRGRVIGFSGRTLEEVSGKNPKYINSGESNWFKKKAVVYGLDRAARNIREDGFVCVVEGYFDQWALHRYEIPAVAVMGTALTPEHLELIGRYTKNVVLVMDVDAAGVASTKKSLPLLIERGWEVRVFSGFEGKDPDEWLRDSAITAEDLKDKLRGAPDGLAWLFRILVKEGASQNMPRPQLLTYVKQAWDLAQTPTQKAMMRDELEPLLGNSFDARTLETILGSGAPRAQPQIRQQALQQRAPGSSRERAAEEAFVWWLWNWDVLKPASVIELDERLRLFYGTTADPFAQWLKSSPILPGIAEVQAWMENSASDEVLKRWILKGLVKPEDQVADDASSAVQSFQELSGLLFRETVRAEISQLRNQLRSLKADPEATALCLKQVQELSLSLEKRK